ncbi:MAG: hypothetical protein B7Z47_04415 [Chthoniobacter sp. 12-60-6]|nr:MAG: hypothetical protein B7Z47_04415 [Chthoniobacter sp. 12-60-6]
MNPAQELIARAKAVGAVTLLDGAQSAGHMPINVRELGCDFFVFSSHKMCGPTGIGVLYGRMALLETMPPWHGGGEMILSVTMESSTYKAPPHRFEAGTPDISGVIGLGAAIDYLTAIGLENIQRHDHNLANYAVQRMGEVPGIRMLGPPSGHRGALVAFHLDFAHPHDLVEFANSHGVAMRGGHHCTQPLMKRFKVPGTTRASFYFYNTIEEINRLVEVLLLARKFFT